jgi:uncharacterized membrane protein YsdA (DUF1294 family)/cold shock CspA family protein
MSMPAGSNGQSAGADQQGVVVKYDQDRGYGFIRPDGSSGEADVFVHIKNVTNATALYQGQRVSYQVTSSAKGPAAVQVHASSRLTVPYLRYMLIGVGVALLLFVGAALLLTPASLLGWLALWAITASIATYGVYRYDKGAAEQGLGRVPEAVLLGLAALGGSIGAWFGMHIPTHHKTAKRYFQVIFWVIVAVQVVVVVFLLTR